MRPAQSLRGLRFFLAVGCFRSAAPVHLVARSGTEELDRRDCRRCGNNRMGCRQVLLAIQVGLDVSTIETDVIEHAAVEACQFTCCPAPDGCVGDRLPQTGEETRLFALGKPYGLAGCGLDAATSDAQVPQLMRIEPGKLANRLTIETTHRGLLCALIKPQGAPQTL